MTMRWFSSIHSSTTLIITTSVAITHLLTNEGVVFVSGQETPNPIFRTNQFNTSVIFRQNVCDRYQRFASGEIPELKDALEGLELRPILNFGPYFGLNEETGGLDEDYPGMLPVLLDELARRARFTWRNSYAISGPPIEGKTWTEFLLWEADTYDISIEWWTENVFRANAGVVYPRGWHDSSIIMVSLIEKNEGDTDDVLTLWSWLVPFDTGVWCMIIATIVFSTIVYMVLEFVDPYSDKNSLRKKPVETTFMVALGFAGHMQ